MYSHGAASGYPGEFREAECSLQHPEVWRGLINCFQEQSTLRYITLPCQLHGKRTPLPRHMALFQRPCYQEELRHPQ